ncbi:hypothetical protein CNR22_04480 [Sphingobacteriaceae bacterium]|nr:hypothetical protein CNR22_04480 [Sphingobacteriaceae bacterium]
MVVTEVSFDLVKDNNAADEAKHKAKNRWFFFIFVFFRLIVHACFKINEAALSFKQRYSNGSNPIPLLYTPQIGFFIEFMPQ